MRPCETLALDAMKVRLQEELRPTVMDVLDELIDRCVFPSSMAIDKVGNLALVPGERVEELLKQLIRISSADGGDKVFTVLCSVLRVERVALGQLAQDLETKASEFEKTATPGEEARCELVRSMSSTEEVVDLRLAELLPELLPGLQVKDISTETNLDKLRRRLHTINEHLCRNATDHSNRLFCLPGDVRKCFIPLQAMSESDAQRLAHRGTQRNRGSGDDAVHRGKVFDLTSATEILAHGTGATGGNPASNAAASAVSDHHSLGQSSCIVIGNAGQGKTTLCRRIVADVSDAATQSGCCLAKLKYVFYIACREVERVKSHDCHVLLGLDHPNLGLSRADQTSVLQHLSTFSDEVLVILDGIDEAGIDGLGVRSAARHLLERNPSSRLPKASILVTSRPHAGAYDLLGTCPRRYRLSGFSDDQLEKFCCENLLSAEKGKECSRKLSETTNRPLQKALRQTPLLCALVVQQYSLTGTIPSSVILVYEMYLRSAVTKLENQKEDGSKFGNVRLRHDVVSPLYGGREFSRSQPISVELVIRYRLEEHVTESNNGDTECDQNALRLIHALRELYRVCFRQYQAGHGGQLTFARTVLHSDHLSLCQSLGLLADVGERLASVDSVELAHFTLQEWCASRAITSSSTCVDAIRSCAQAVGIDENTHVFWRFVFGGLHPEYLPAAVDAIQSAPRVVSNHARKATTLFLIRSVLENELSFQHTANPYMNTSNVPAEASSVTTAGYYAAAAKLLCAEGINVEGVQLDIVDVMAIRNILLHVDVVKLLSIASCNLPGEGIQLLSDVLDRCSEAHLRGNNLGGLPLERISIALMRSNRRNIRRLDLNHTSLTCGRRDGLSIARCAQYPGLATLEMTDAQLGNDGLAAFSGKLLSCQHLTRLSLAYCSLQSGCGSSLALLVSKLPQLCILWLENNALCNADAESVLEALHPHTAVRHLLFNNNKLNDDLASAVVCFLKARRSRERGEALGSTAGQQQSTANGGAVTCFLYLTGNAVTTRLLDAIRKSGHCGTDRVHICSHYATDKSVEPVGIESLVAKYGGNLQGHVDDAMMVPLGQFLAANTGLEVLGIASCQITDVGAIALSQSGLADNTCLQYIRLYRNLITLSGVLALLGALKPPRSTVRALNFEHNPVFHSVAEPRHDDCTLLMDLLLAVHQLRFISFCSTGLSDDLGARILLAFKEHEHIAWIDLGDNSVADGTARALAEMKTGNGSMKQISLENNKITQDGIAALLRSPAVMQMVAVYLFSNPGLDGDFQAPLLDAESRYSSASLIEFIAEND